MNSIRAFLAVTVPATAPLRAVLAELGTMGRSVRPVADENLHVTLKFFGEVNAKRVPEIANVLQKVLAGRAPFDAKMVGLGAFPHARRPSVVWAGFEQAEPLAEIAEELELELADLGFATEKRRFHAHATLARVKSKPPPELAELLARHASTEFGVAPVESIELYQSDLGPEGARYTVLARAEMSE